METKLRERRAILCATLCDFQFASLNSQRNGEIYLSLARPSCAPWLARYLARAARRGRHTLTFSVGDRYVGPIVREHQINHHLGLQLVRGNNAQEVLEEVLVAQVARGCRVAHLGHVEQLEQVLNLVGGLSGRVSVLVSVLKDLTSELEGGGGGAQTGRAWAGQSPAQCRSRRLARPRPRCS